MSFKSGSSFDSPVEFLNDGTLMPQKALILSKMSVVASDQHLKEKIVSTVTDRVNYYGSCPYKSHSTSIYPHIHNLEGFLPMKNRRFRNLLSVLAINQPCIGSLEFNLRSTSLMLASKSDGPPLDSCMQNRSGYKLCFGPLPRSEAGAWYKKHWAGPKTNCSGSWHDGLAWQSEAQELYCKLWWTSIKTCFCDHLSFSPWTWWRTRFQ